MNKSEKIAQETRNNVTTVMKLALRIGRFMKLKKAITKKRSEI
jgi:hypothetical protein